MCVRVDCLFCTCYSIVVSIYLQVKAILKGGMASYRAAGFPVVSSSRINLVRMYIYIYSVYVFMIMHRELGLCIRDRMDTVRC